MRFEAVLPPAHGFWAATLTEAADELQAQALQVQRQKYASELL